MNNTQTKIENRKSKIENSLRWGGLALLIAGFAGPWVYGPLGKTNDWGWQPVWGLFLSVLAFSVFLVVSLASCYTYVEFVLRQGKPPLTGVLQWVGSFLALVLVEPLIVWLLVDLSQRNPVRQQPDGALGWGLWLALAGQIIQLIGLRLAIQGLKRASK